jgi:hypothetical protein
MELQGTTTRVPVELSLGFQTRLKFTFVLFAERIRPHCVMSSAGCLTGVVSVIGRRYFARQAATLLKFANSTTNPQLAAVLVEKAAHLKSQVDETDPPPDQSPRPPDVETPRPGDGQER